MGSAACDAESNVNTTRIKKKTDHVMKFLKE